MKSTIPAIQRELYKLKKLIPTSAVCFAFLEETGEKSVYSVRETIYRSRADPQSHEYEITAASIQEAAEKYRFPEYCDMEQSILFVDDFGE